METATQPGSSADVPAHHPKVRRPRRPLSRRKRAVFVLLTLALAWIAVEGIVYAWLKHGGFRWERKRTRRHPNILPDNMAPNPRYLWSYVPGSEFTFTHPKDGTSFHIRINSAGFRDEEPHERDGAGFRFVALGDSFTFGWLVEPRDRWDEVLAGRIGETTGGRAASVNLGMWNTTFDQHALILEDHLPERCDAVIHLVYPPHLQTINRHTVEEENGRMVVIRDPLMHLKDGALYFGVAEDALVRKKLYFPFTHCLVSFHLNARRLGARVKHRLQVPDMSDVDLYYEDSQESFRHAYELTEKAISQIAAFLEERDVPYIVVLIPRDRQLAAEEWNDTQPLREILETAVPQQKLREICARAGSVRLIDLLPVMRERYREDLYYEHDSHWRPGGHRLAAEAVLRFLAEQGLLAGTAE